MGAKGRRMISGLCCVYHVLSFNVSDCGRLGEMFLPGCFTESLLRRRNVRCNLNHNRKQPLGSLRRGTLRLYPQLRGIAFELDRDELPEGCQGASITFHAEAWRTVKNVTYLVKGDLRGIS